MGMGSLPSGQIDDFRGDVISNGIHENSVVVQLETRLDRDNEG